jgi:hypothetical protein
MDKNSHLKFWSLDCFDFSIFQVFNLAGKFKPGIPAIDEFLFKNGQIWPLFTFQIRRKVFGQIIEYPCDPRS